MHEIMLVEDDETMRTLLETLFQLEGFQVSQLDGSQPELLLETLRRETPMAVIMDVHLGATSGLDLLRRVRSVPELGRLPVYMTSGLDMSTDCIAAGATGFLQKPYMPGDLIQLMRSHREDGM